MNKLKKLKEILVAYDDNVASNEGATAYESDRLIQGMRYILNQPDEIDLDIVKPTASEVKQIVNDALRLHMRNYHGGHEGGGRF